MVTVNVLAFGVVKEIVNGSSLVLPMEDGVRVSDLKVKLEHRFPRLRELTSFTIAINGSYATSDAIINSGDEVAIIPPVSGG